MLGGSGTAFEESLGRYGSRGGHERGRRPKDSSWVERAVLLVAVHAIQSHVIGAAVEH